MILRLNLIYIWLLRRFLFLYLFKTPSDLNFNFWWSIWFRSTLRLILFSLQFRFVIFLFFLLSKLINKRFETMLLGNKLCNLSWQLVNLFVVKIRHSLNLHPMFALKITLWLFNQPQFLLIFFKLTLKLNFLLWLGLYMLILFSCLILHHLYIHLLLQHCLLRNSLLLV